MASYARRVRSVTAATHEQASAFYFPQVFGRSFHRSQNSWTNAALDYGGYAVTRGRPARGRSLTHGMPAQRRPVPQQRAERLQPGRRHSRAYRPVVDLRNGPAAAIPSKPRTTKPVATTADKAALVEPAQCRRGHAARADERAHLHQRAAESLARLFDSGNERCWNCRG